MMYSEAYQRTRDIDWFFQSGSRCIHVASNGGALPWFVNDVQRLREEQAQAGNVSKRTFSDFIHSVFPDRSKDSIYRALYRTDDTTSRSIVADIVKYFRSVADIVERDLQK